MNNKNIQYYFLLACILFAGVIAFSIIRPFFYVLVFSGVFAVIFQPIHQKILKFTKQRAGLAAMISTLVIILCILIPLALIGMQIFSEVTQLYHSLSAANGDKNILSLIKDAMRRLENAVPAFAGFTFEPEQYIKQVASWLMQNLGAVFSNLASIMTGLFIFIFGLFYLLKDGHKLKSAIMKLSPLSDKDDTTIILKLQAAINSVIKGSIFVALIQGVAVTIGLAIFGVPNAFLWGSLAVISALIPAVGTSLILIPSIIYLFLNGHIIQGVGLVIWAALGVGLIDNFLSPRIVGQGIKMHPLVTFLATLGGLAYFGIAGFVLGPLMISILFTLLDIYFTLAEKTDS